MRLLVIAIVFYLGGLAIHLTYGNNSPGYTAFYYIWEKGKDLLFLLSILYLIPKEHRWLIKPLWIYALIRLLWEIIKPFTDLATDHPTVIKGLFTALLTGVIILLIKDLRQRKKRWEQNS